MAQGTSANGPVPLTMRLVSDSQIVTLTDEDKDYWHDLSDISNWTFAFIIFGQVMFIRDVVVDFWSIYDYGAGGQWVPLFETLAVLFAAGIFQSYHYYQGQKWIDANHKYFRQPSSEQSSYSNLLPNRIQAPISSDSWYFKMRLFFQIFLLTPPFRALTTWSDRKEKHKTIKKRRARRMPIDRKEITAAVTTSEQDVTNHTLQLIELCFESLPQSVLQIYFANRDRLPFEFSSYAGFFRLLAIIVSGVATAVTSTLYNRDYFKNLKTLHFKDYFFFGYKMDLCKIDLTTSFLLFFTHLLIIGQRLYGIAVMFVLYGQVRAVFFLIFLYTLQSIWLQVNTNCRLFYENPPRGICTTYSNIVDRWMNMFTFHMLKPKCWTLFWYNFIFFGSLSTCTKIFDSPPIASIFHQAFDTNDNNTLLNNTITNTTAQESETYETAFSSFHYILYVWLITTVLCLVFGYFIENRLEPLLKHQFPLTKGFPFWNDVLNNLKWDNVNSDMTRHICLCVLATDTEFCEVFDPVCCKLGIGNLSWDKLNELWASKVRLLITDRGLTFEQLSTEWEQVRSDKVKNKDMDILIGLIDRYFSRNYTDCDLSDLQIFLNLVQHFELRLTKQTSFRLMRTERFVEQVLNRSYASFTTVDLTG